MKKITNRPPVIEGDAECEPFSGVHFTMGELYLFHPSDPTCPANGSLWGVFDKRSDALLYLESSSTDLIHFSRWHRLPDGFRYCRRATRSELRDYTGNLSWTECTLTLARSGSLR